MYKNASIKINIALRTIKLSDFFDSCTVNCVQYILVRIPYYKLGIYLLGSMLLHSEDRERDEQALQTSPRTIGFTRWNICYFCTTTYIRIHLQYTCTHRVFHDNILIAISTEIMKTIQFFFFTRTTKKNFANVHILIRIHVF